jgi:hypothetical protein
MKKTFGIAAIAVFMLSPGAGSAGAQPVPPELLLRMTLENTSRQPLGPGVITNPNLQLQTYGDGKNILVAIGRSEYDPHTFDGLCEKPCGMTLRDQDKLFDLRGKAKIKWTTIVSGFHRVRPLVKLADGTLLIGDPGDGSVADWHQSEVSFSEVRWLKLDPARGVTLGQWVENPDLSKVDEVGYFDLMPGSGTPPGGWVAIAALELWGKPVSRESAGK